MTKEQFSMFMGALKTYYPHTKVTNEMMKLWFYHLSDIPYQTAAVALQKWADKSQFAPSIAEIRKQVKDIMWMILEEKQGNEFLDVYAEIKKMEQHDKELPSQIKRIGEKNGDM